LNQWILGRMASTLPLDHRRRLVNMLHTYIKQKWSHVMLSEKISNFILTDEQKLWYATFLEQLINIRLSKESLAFMEPRG
jgi:hypothetical protein